MARLGIEILELGNHFLDVFKVDLAERLERCKIALGDKIEIGNQGCHGRIEAVAFAQLEAEAFLQIGGEDADGIKGLERFENARHMIARWCRDSLRCRQISPVR